MVKINKRNRLLKPQASFGNPVDVIKAYLMQLKMTSVTMTSSPKPVCATPVNV